MNKRFFILLLLLSCILCGCSSDSAQESSVSSPAAESTAIATTEAQVPSATETPAETPTEIPTEAPTEVVQTEGRRQCILCGHGSYDLPISAEGICQGCHGILNETPCGFCVDCGATVKDPATFDPYHCTGCGNSVGFECGNCGNFLRSVDAIQWMCVDCYRRAGSGNAHCTRCGGMLDSRNEAHMLCSSCWEFMRHGTQRPCDGCGILLYSWERYHNLCFTCNGAPTALPLQSEEDREEECVCIVCGGLYPVSQTTYSVCRNCDPTGQGYIYYCSQCGTGCKVFDGLEGLCYSCYESQTYYCRGCGTAGSPSQIVSGLCDACRATEGAEP